MTRHHDHHNRDPIDPDTTLAQLRDMITRIYQHWDGHHELPSGQLEATALRIAELADALDHWLTSGRPPPTDWTHP